MAALAVGTLLGVGLVAAGLGLMVGAAGGRASVEAERATCVEVARRQQESRLGQRDQWAGACEGPAGPGRTGRAVPVPRPAPAASWDQARREQHLVPGWTPST